ncbi:conserved hypothetical protein [Parafrankia sp. EAN1pec]|uniref:integrase n=1 Tax=Parafrankia sp. (strain EAN1pec) TaxID=298653 RepID=UPI0000542AB8|nr:conserved hypothetical protein [Frankia sp. EAN1pec]
MWLNFLEVFGRRWDAAAAGDVEAFKDWRLTDQANDGRIAPASFDADRAALNCFYSWASARYGVVNPVPSGRWARTGRSYGAAEPRWGSRDPLRPAGAAKRQVKWLLRSAFEQWRDVGLRGYGFDDVRHPDWRGPHEDRDAAFVDGLYGTGLRLTEWATILDVELPGPGGEPYPRAWLAAACAKGGRHGRVYRIPRRALTEVHGYLDPREGSRAEKVRQAQRSGRYERLAVRRIVTGYNPRARTLTVEGSSGLTRISVDVLRPHERRCFFRQTECGLEPLALWLGRDGLPKHPHGWEDTFTAANRRIERAWFAAGHNSTAPLWCTPHMCRHSFALKWFSVLSLVWDNRLSGFSAEELKDYRAQFGDIWYQLAGLLGHADPSTTREHYLEPFTSLDVDYLMALLDTEEQTTVDTLLRAVAADSGRTLTTVVAADAGTAG